MAKGDYFVEVDAELLNFSDGINLGSNYKLTIDFASPDDPLIYSFDNISFDDISTPTISAARLTSPDIKFNLIKSVEKDYYSFSLDELQEVILPGLKCT